MTASNKVSNEVSELTPELLAELEELRAYKAAKIAKAEAAKLSKLQGNLRFKVRRDFAVKYFDNTATESDKELMEEAIQEAFRTHGLI